MTATNKPSSDRSSTAARFAPEEIAEHLAELDDRAEKFSFGKTRFDYMYGSSADIIRYLRDRAARLDATNTEMLAALQEIQTQFECPARNTNRGRAYREGVTISDDVREMARAAIAKATGAA